MVRKSASTTKAKTKSITIPAVTPGVNTSICVEQISNGFLVTEERYNEKSHKFSTNKTFSKTKPTIKVGPSS